MASVVNRPNGRREIQYADANGRRQTLRLGRMPKRTAESVKVYVEHLLTAKLSKQPIDGETAKWVARLDEVLTEKLAKLGLLESRGSATLGAFIEKYKADRADVKLGTRKAWQATHKSLVEYFGSNKPLRAITKGDAAAWRRSIVAGRAENTVRKRTAIAKTLFNVAKDYRLIELNPFDGLKSAMVENPKRMYFVTAEDSRKVLEACPNTDWKVIFALARYGGLRCPTEVLGLKWSDVLWDKQRFLVRCVKTEHHVGHEERVVPIFPELPHTSKRRSMRLQTGLSTLFARPGILEQLTFIRSRILCKDVI
ncbi:MAG: site-specific integrase [Planctomycetes bacterium]|nr:site-specific integrase [Planctomycetota bacterium]